MRIPGTVAKRTYRSGKRSWYFEIDLPGSDGTRRRLTKSGFRTKREACDALAEAIVGIGQQSYATPNSQSLAEFLAEWLRVHADENLSAKTAARYRELVEKYVLPRMGDVRLKELEPLQLERLYAELRRSGGRGGRQLSAKTVRHVHGTLHSALQKAARWKRLIVNPASMVELPKLEKPRLKTADRTDVEFILETVCGTPLYIPTLIGALTGARRGEVLALDWPSVDFENGMITVARSLQQVGSTLAFKSPKTGNARVLPIPRVLIRALGSHRKPQDHNRRLFGIDYRTDLDLVVCQPDGSPMYPDRFTAAFCAHARRVGKRGFSFHALRHAHASHLIANGIPVTVISRRLGHSVVSTTLNIYGHAFHQDERRAADVMDKLFASADPSLDAVPRH